VESIKEWLKGPEGIGAGLRTLRVRAGLSGKELAEASGWAPSKVSRIETGQQMPTPEDVMAWGTACGASEAEVTGLLARREESRIAMATFRDRMTQGQSEVQEDYNALVQRSTLIRHFETIYVPGLLQTPEYAQRVLAEMIKLHNLDIDDVDAAVVARSQRTRYLYDRTKRFEFLLFEPVLRTKVAEPVVMRAQLDRLQTVIGLETVRFGVIPMDSEVLRWTPQASVQIYAGDDTVAVTEDLAGEHWHRDRAAAYGHGVDLLWEEAVESDGARGLISAASERLREQG
jgi:transcriptional regulator with XRE-family HTH domain